LEVLRGREKSCSLGNVGSKGGSNTEGSSSGGRYAAKGVCRARRDGGIMKSGSEVARGQKSTVVV
jgi:hypothetical protein